MTDVKKQPRSWWFNSHKSAPLSPWLRSTLSELEQKTEGMLELLEEGADSFRQCASMFYEKRPELVNMVEDLYRTHRSLAERYDKLKHRNTTDKCESCSDSSDALDSEVDDPLQGSEPDSQVEALSIKDVDTDDLKLKIEELERLKEENHVIRAQLVVKDNEKREAIRQLSSFICMLKDDNADLRRCIKDVMNKGLFQEFKKLKKIFSWNFF